MYQNSRQNHNSNPNQIPNQKQLFDLNQNQLPNPDKNPDMTFTRIPGKRNRRRKRVAAYCRVSTSKKEQEDSFQTQEAYYTALIRSHKDWIFAGIYSDTRSGTSTENRPGFRSLLRDALSGKIDLILVKSISRFSRNIVDFQRSVRILTGNGVNIYFEKEHLDTSDPSCHMMLSFLSVIAQNESHSISMNLKWSYRKRLRTHLYGPVHLHIRGYDCVHGKLVPNRESFAIRMIYELYASDHPIEEIRRLLASKGILTRSGTPLSHSNILYILQNEAYIGDRRLLKTTVRKNSAKKTAAPARSSLAGPLIQGPAQETGEMSPASNQIPGDTDTIYLKADHTPIIPYSLWKTVSEKLQRSRQLANLAGHPGGRPHFLYGKLFCAACGAPMTRRTLTSRKGARHKVWVCRERRKGKAGNGCTMRKIQEDELLRILCDQLGYANSGGFPADRFFEDISRVQIGMTEIHFL